MHSRKRVSFGHDLCFFGCEYGESGFDLFAGCVSLCQTHVGGVMSGLRFEQATVEVGQVFFFKLVAQ